MDKKGFTTTILHFDRENQPGHGAVHMPIYNSTAYEYSDAHDLADVFQGNQSGYAYARQSNPTTTVLEKKVSVLEDGVGSVGFATGMAAIGSTFLSLLRQGDHVVSSKFLFGNTHSLFKTFNNWGIDVSFVDVTDVKNVAAAITDRTRMVFVETIANPITQIADLEKIGELCATKNLIYVVDNSLTSPYLFRPKSVNASLVINSLTKSISGHGNTLGGAVTDTGLFNWEEYSNIYTEYKKGKVNAWALTQIRKKGLRDFGATLTAPQSHMISQGMETLALRMERATANAQKVADFFQANKHVNRVYYPGLVDHQQHKLAQKLFSKPGFLMSVDLANGIDCFDFLNNLKLVVKSTHLGDNRTLALPVAHTIFYEMGPENRKAMGIGDNMIRFSIGIEDPEDLLGDIENSLNAIK